MRQTQVRRQAYLSLRRLGRSSPHRPRRSSSTAPRFCGQTGWASSSLRTQTAAAANDGKTSTDGLRVPSHHSGGRSISARRRSSASDLVWKQARLPVRHRDQHGRRGVMMVADRKSIEQGTSDVLAASGRFVRIPSWSQPIRRPSVCGGSSFAETALLPAPPSPTPAPRRPRRPPCRLHRPLRRSRRRRRHRLPRPRRRRRPVLTSPVTALAATA